MMLAADDRFVLMELISLHGHLVDAGELDAWMRSLPTTWCTT